MEKSEQGVRKVKKNEKGVNMWRKVSKVWEMLEE